ncbi:MAG: alpha-glucan family phosphorylase [Verrucomicrobia bacterium]|nr:alpha-glucan family phosphorylase [Verrucomicrobiota bacterium]
MKNIRTFEVVASLPEELSPLRTLAYNLWWSWNAEAIELFLRMDRDLWRETYHSPILMLGRISQERLGVLKNDGGFLAHMKRVMARLERYMNDTTWYHKVHDGNNPAAIAYFSLEFGIHECLPIYSGGLGVLAGDHLKSASDLGVPLVGVGLLYRRGYFHQRLDANGWQLEVYPDNDFYNMPITLVRNPEGLPLIISLDYPGRTVRAQIWRAQVGRVPLYLLDTNIESNSPADRDITASLYGGDSDMRIRQEIMLGIGGCRALQALGLNSHVCHMNEGHAAFLGLERVRRKMKENHLSFAEAREIVSAGGVFTTHTPVPAGIDVFHADLMEHYFHGFRQELGLDRNDFLGLGRQNPADNTENFNMAVLALRFSAKRNGVSKLHGEVSRRMWQRMWPEVPEQEVPITAITNGVHSHSWLSREMAALFETYLGLRLQEEPTDQSVWQGIKEIPDAELWRTHERRRERLVAYARRRLREQLRRRGAMISETAHADEVLDPKVLTIGFARRFATYKRGNLLLRDAERFKRLLTNSDLPVQIIFAGKAHPNDGPGKELIRQIVQFARESDIRNRVVFLEDYDVNTAHYLVQGCDVWLNTPRRPLEASGTSGMKATVNGALNVSTLDGWWCEVEQADNGWSIGHGEDYTDPNYQDEVESRALYDLLEKEIVPLFYERGADGLPRRWIAMMKNSMSTIGPIFNSHRMVQEYVEQSYVPCAQRHQRLASDNMGACRQFTGWKHYIAQNWGKVRLSSVQQCAEGEQAVGAELPVAATVHVGDLKPENIALQLFYGPLEADGRLARARSVPMKLVRSNSDGTHRFIGAIPCQATGRHGFAVRVVPAHPDLGDPLDTGLILWG